MISLRHHHGNAAHDLIGVLPKRFIAAFTRQRRKSKRRPRLHEDTVPSQAFDIPPEYLIFSSPDRHRDNRAIEFRGQVTDAGTGLPIAGARVAGGTLLVVSAVGFSWLGMMAVHELGHVLHLVMTGGTVDYVVLHPLAISYTHPGENPHPLAVAWGGAIWGCVLSVVAFVVVRWLARPWAYLAAFFAGFCLLANGAYLAGDVPPGLC